MASRISRKTALAAALALAGASMFGSAASAQKWQRDPVCDARVANECVSTWQSLGYWDYNHCVAHQQCMQCPPFPGYLCGIGPGDYYAVEPDAAARPW